MVQTVALLLADLHSGMATAVRLQSDLAADLGLDSLAVVELHDRLESAFAVTLPEELLASAATPNDWLRAILEASGRRAATSSVPLPAKPAPRPTGEAWPANAETLTDALAWHVNEHPDLVSVVVLGARGENASEELSYGALAAQATRAARGLVAEGLGRGERVAIMLPTGREYFVTFLAVLLAGGVPVPIYPPARPSAIEQHLGRQARLLDDAGASFLVTVPEARLAARLVRPHVPSLRSVRTPAMLSEAGTRPARLPAVAADDVALIQYTSGSTGDPRGVVLTHAQVLANVRAMGRAVAVDTSDVFVSWLPLYHDMGLIGAWHASMFFGLELVVLSPLQFLARPATWLEAISHYAGTLSAAPNFAYESCVERIGDAQLAALDLSSWRVAINGSEPVSALTLERFARRFASCGFRREAMCPAYGLAEVGVGLTFTPLGRGPRVDTVAREPLQRSAHAVPAAPGAGAIAVVGSGVPLPGYEVRVTGRRGDELADRREGAVECRGPSATAGYFHNDSASRALWHRGWLDTGDLGYISEGELFLTGRAKDLVIRGGRNVHPEDLELALGELDGVRRGEVAVFASADPRRGTERLVVVAESELKEHAARAALRARLNKRAVDLLGSAPDEVMLVPRGAILRTPSGKIRRAATRDAFESGVLKRRPAPVVVQLARFGWSGLRPSGRRLRGEVGAWGYAAYAWALVALIGVPLWIAVQLPLSPGMRWVLVRGACRTLRALAGIDLKVHGPLPPAGLPAVVAANHPSFVDGLVLLLAFPTPVVFVASSDLERQFLVGSFLRRLGCAFVHRGQAGRSSDDVGQLAALVRGGRRVVVFPEGSITRAPALRSFHLGAFAAAAAAGCPVTPVGIRGTRDVVRPGTRFPRRADVEVVIGPPLAPGGDDFAGRLELSERVRRAIAELSKETEVA